MELIRRTPHGSTWTYQATMRLTHAISQMVISLGQHSRAGIELDWRNIMEKLFNVWRENSLSIWAWIFFLGAIAAIIYYSFKA